MWISDGWKDYELLDCSDGEKLERWGRYVLLRPDPQAIWRTPRDPALWGRADAQYSRASTGGGSWSQRRVPERWELRYRSLTFQVGPMNFKHTGAVPRAGRQLGLHRWRRSAARGGPSSVLNLFAYTGGRHGGRRRGGRRGLPCGRRPGHGGLGDGRTPGSPGWRRRPSAGLWTTAASSSSGRSAGAAATTP